MDARIFPCLSSSRAHDEVGSHQTKRSLRINWSSGVRWCICKIYSPSTKAARYIREKNAMEGSSNSCNEAEEEKKEKSHLCVMLVFAVGKSRLAGSRNLSMETVITRERKKEKGEADYHYAHRAYRWKMKAKDKLISAGDRRNDIQNSFEWLYVILRYQCFLRS